jgi:SAM-dependent methyltransferase
VIAIELEERVCPLCGTGAHSRLFADARFDPSRVTAMSYSSRKTPERMHHRLMECSSCDVLYAGPIPSVASLDDAYHDAAYESTLEARYAAATYRRLLDRFVRDLPDLRGALDIGAGDGAFLEELRSAGFDRIVGFEPSAAPRAAASEELRTHIRPEPFAPDLLPEDAFTLVSCLQTIEHVPDPLGLCREAARVLAPGGAVMIVCHSRRALSARLPNRASPIFDIEHLQLFSPKSVRILLERSGFRRIEVARVANRYPLGYWLRLAPLAPTVSRRMQRALELARVSRLPLRIPAGNLIAVGHTARTGVA